MTKSASKPNSYSKTDSASKTERSHKEAPSTLVPPKKLMLIGRSGSGKTTLLQSLNNQIIEYQKTQAMQFSHSAIDTPGEYLENPRLYSALINASYDADVIALVQCADNPHNIFAPQFATAFNKRVIGIITKADVITEQEAHLITQQLIDAGASIVLSTSAYNNTGIIQLRQFLNWE
ncbi:EutP/PduV family microcompartment system protein [Vibrio sp. TH_r3]|uniref:EutP/PduV family microcompartment system protein n=1 Tax=Vibrio sp. TH_r3 TaxID=3082084 RepID=UPI002952C326|nr:EutP/PduV family microcompartment system protein [Vibrio sp. TH_r3]MDV7103669.1 EutP/PduV family microcompartment system protein [Vibrio sp. TH_r3]